MEGARKPSQPGQPVKSPPGQGEHVDRCGHQAHRQGKDLRPEKRPLDTLQGGIPPPQLRTPPDNPGRFKPRLARRP